MLGVLCWEVNPVTYTILHKLFHEKANLLYEALVGVGTDSPPVGTRERQKDWSPRAAEPATLVIVRSAGGVSGSATGAQILYGRAAAVLGCCSG